MQEAAMAWPYHDVERDDPLTALRIPVTGRRPRHGFIAAVHGVPDPVLDTDPLLRPSEIEAAQIASYINYMRGRVYREGWAQRMLAEPLDADPGQVTLVLHKYGPTTGAIAARPWTAPGSPRRHPSSPRSG